MITRATYIRTFLVAAVILWICGTAGPAPCRAAGSEDGPVRLLEDRDYFPALMEAVEGARSEIVMSFFLFKTNGHRTSYPDRLAAALARAAGRGVRVRIILERGNGTGDSLVDASNRETSSRLKEGGIDVRFDSPSVTTHTKVAVIDGRRLFLGSHNLTSSALKYNHELSVCIDSPPLAGEVLRYIDSLYK